MKMSVIHEWKVLKNVFWVIAAFLAVLMFLIDFGNTNNVSYSVGGGIGVLLCCLFIRFFINIVARGVTYLMSLFNKTPLNATQRKVVSVMVPMLIFVLIAAVSFSFTDEPWYHFESSWPFMAAACFSIAAFEIWLWR